MTPTSIAIDQPKYTTWKSRSTEKVLAQFSSAVTGLSPTDATKRLATDGPNKSNDSKRSNTLQIFL